MLTLRTIRRLTPPVCLLVFPACRAADTIAPQLANKYLVTTNDSIIPAGSTLTVTAQLADANNNPLSVKSREVKWRAVGIGIFGDFSPVSSTTNSYGVATTTYATLSPLVRGSRSPR